MIIDPDFGHEPIFCSTTVNGRSVTGTFRVENDSIGIRLVDFGNKIDVVDNSNLELRLETGHIATAEVSTSRMTWTGGGKSLISSTTLNSWQAIIGFRGWNNHDLVTSFTLFMNATNGFFTTEDLRKELETDIRNNRDQTILYVSLSDFDLKCYHAVSMSSASRNANIWGVATEFNFRDPIRISEIDRYTEIFSNFLSFSVGNDVEIAGIKLTAFENHHQVEQKPSQRFDSQFELKRKKVSVDPNQIDVIPHQSIFRCFSREDRQITKTALIKWFQNDKEWNNARAAMRRAAKFKFAYDGDRLINACKWFESTPLFSANRVIEKAKMQRIVKLVQESIDLPYPNMQNRICGAVMKLAFEDRNSQAGRAINSIRNLLGQVDTSEILQDMNDAMRARGAFAHEKFSHRDDSDFERTVRTTQAMELVCASAMLYGLELGAQIPRFNPGHFFASYM